jgi:hypothetical protein
LLLFAQQGDKVALMGEKRTFLGGAPRGYPALETCPKNADRVSRMN